jgi:hypothetical protein
MLIPPRVDCSFANAPSEVICRNFQIGGPSHVFYRDSSVLVAGNVLASQQTESTSNTTPTVPPMKTHPSSFTTSLARRLAAAFGSLLALCFVLIAPPSYAATSVYVVPPTNNTRILPSTILPAGMASRTVTITACKGEYEPATFVIQNTSSTNIPGAVVAATNLVRSGGAETIPAANVDVRVVKCWWQAGSKIWDLTHKQLVPELLLKDDSLVRVSESAGTNELNVSGSYVLISDPNGVILNGVRTDFPATAQFPVQDADAIQPFDIPANSNKQIWVTVKVPATAIAGTYTGTITIGNTGGGDAGIAETVTLNVVVPGFTLLPPAQAYSLYYRGRLAATGTISSEGKNRAQFTAEMKDMASHGVTEPTLYGQGSDANLTQALTIRTEQGVNNSDLYYLGLTVGSYGTDTAALQNEVSRVKALVQPYGVTQLFLYGIDEQPLSPYVSQIAAVHTAGAKVFCAEGAANASDALSAGLDLLISAGAPTNELATIWHNSGRQIFSYANPQGGEETPASYRRNFGMTLCGQQYDGAMTYAYQHSFGNGWNDFDSLQYRDHNLTYPTANGVIDTIAWEGFREAVDDVRYATTLDTKILEVLAGGDAALKKTAKAAQAWLNTFLASTVDLDSMRARMTRYLLRLNNLGASPELTSPDLVGHWSFEGITSLPYVSDKSGWENTGELVNMAAEVADGTAFPVGKIEDGIRLNRSKKQYVDCGTGAALRNTSTAITVAAWVKPTSDTKDNLVIHCSDTSSYARYRWSIVAGRLNLWTTTGTQGWHSGGYGQVRTWTDGWHHIAWTYDSATHATKFYVDGALDFSSTTINIGAMPTAPLRFVRIGGNENNKYFDGDLDEVKIYNRALAQNEVQQIARSGSLRAKWSFEEPAGSEIFADDSGWPNIGNPSGTTSYEVRVAGKRGNGIRLQQSKSQYIDYGAAPSLQDTSAAITVAAWVKPTSDTQSQGIIYCSDTSSYARYRLAIVSGKLNLWTTTGTQGWHNGGVGQVRTWTGGWHHIAWTYDSATHTTNFYVDGALDFSSTTSNIGAMPNAPPALYQGRRG